MTLARSIRCEEKFSIMFSSQKEGLILVLKMKGPTKYLPFYLRISI